MERISRYFHTLRYLRLRQLWFQAWKKLPRRRPGLSRPPTLLSTPVRGWVMSARREPSLLGPETMAFLEVTQNIGRLGWSGDGASLLWRYNQHYFDDLSARDSSSRREWHSGLITSWLAANPPGSRPGWDPYPTSLRLVNWSKWLLSGSQPVEGQIRSMALQARFLARSLEYHVLGNHLLANAKALVFAGTLFKGEEADSWLKRGLRILRSELPEQVLGDGGNFERSPMYHALCLEDLLDLVNLSGGRPERIPADNSDQWREIAAGMRFWLQTMCHPDGEIAHFNDAAIGIAPSPAELARYGDELGVAAIPAPGVRRLDDSLIWLRASGYIRAEADDAVLFCDIARIGPDYLPAHSHADTLSFELSVGGRRVIVNGGTSRYGNSPERVAERGTAAHSTVTLAGKDSSEVWGGFRVARRARPFAVRVQYEQRGALVAASHDGYKRLARSPIHRRTWKISGRSLEIIDEVSSALPAIARFIAHPDLAIDRAEDSAFHFGPLRLAVNEGHGSRAPAFHSAGFGRRRSTEAVCIALEGGRSVVGLTW